MRVTHHPTIDALTAETTAETIVLLGATFKIEPLPLNTPPMRLQGRAKRIAEFT